MFLDENRLKELKNLKKDELIELIDQLEKDNYYLKDNNSRLERWLEKTELERSKYLKEMQDYREKYSKLEDKVFLKEQEELRKIKTFLKHNARGAGRKNKFNAEQIQEIKQLRAEGQTIKALAEKYNCTTGLIHKLINKNE